MDPTPASIQVSVNGNITQALYDSQLAYSFILLSFCNINHLYYHCLDVCNTVTTVAVAYSIFLGRDWFKICSTGLEDPEATVHLSLLNQWLLFAAS